MGQQKQCGGCGTNLTEDSVFCHSCGDKFEESNNLVCPECATELEKGTNFCGVCGKNISSATRIEEGVWPRPSGSDFNYEPFFTKNHLKYLFLRSSGRINRQRYFYGFLLLWIVGAIVAVILAAIAPELGPFILLPFLIFTVLLGVKRCHDMNRSGFYIIFCFIPIVHLIAYGFLFLASGTDGPNRFGDDPRT